MEKLVIKKNEKWTWPANDENSWMYQNQYNELADYVLPYVKEKNIMIQAGGNCGFVLSTFIDHFNHIYTFEPDPINFYCLNQNITNQNVIKLQCCLGNNNIPVKTQQLIRPDKPNDTGGVYIAGEGYTPSIKIDNLNLPDCSLIQLDVEGYELEAILGGINTIKKYKPVLCIEFCEKWLNRYEASSDKILGVLKELNYIHVKDYGVDKIFVYNEL
jgi:FkbM family methyltransferase